MNQVALGAPSPGLLTWSEIWCDVENSKSFRSSRDRRVFPGHRLKSASALHNYPASIFTAPSVTTWSGMSGNTRKNQVTRLVTVRHWSIMSGALVTCAPTGGDKPALSSWAAGSRGTRRARENARLPKKACVLFLYWARIPPRCGECELRRRRRPADSNDNGLR